MFVFTLGASGAPLAAFCSALLAVIPPGVFAAKAGWPAGAVAWPLGPAL
jgi:hypothetical protein